MSRSEPGISCKRGRYGDPSWTEVETDHAAPEATDRALGILARWLVGAAPDPGDEDIRPPGPEPAPNTASVAPDSGKTP